ncbi:hypothetical protein, partial [Campylobacter troglodytis]|uniref:hypothetical protein n=1 Tax=Campylobacter troglodytis TaxID=654363 RepID=UPI00163B8FA4
VPNLNDAFVVLDLGFRVGEGEDGSVVEGSGEGVVWDTNYINEWKNIKNIANLKTAYQFIAMLVYDLTVSKKSKRLNQNDIINYLELNPNLAGKLAYIYYRFDLSSNIKENYQAYKKDLKTFTQTINFALNEPYLNTSLTLKEALRQENDLKKWCDEFLKLINKDLILDLNISYKKLGNNIYGTYNPTTNALEININKASNKKEFLRTLIHELRHAYIHKKQPMDDDLLKYLFYSSKYFYFSKEDRNYYKFKTFQMQGDDLYFLQPSERDARLIEKMIRI